MSTGERRALDWAWALLTRRDRWKLHLGAAAGVVLAAGVLMAPRAPTPVVKAPEDAAAPLLREALQRRDASTVFRDVQELGATVGDRVVSFLARPDAAAPVQPDFAAPAPLEPVDLGDGLLVSDGGEVLTHVSALGHRIDVEVALGTGARTTARVVAYEPDTGLVLARLAEVAVPTEVRLSGDPLASGELAAAVTRPQGRPVATPVYIASSGGSELTLAAFSEGLAAGTPIFNLEGDAVAVVAGRPRTAQAVPAALNRLRRLAESRRGLPRTLGLVLQEVTPALRPLVGAVPVVVAAVEEGGPAGQAGLLPGDGLVRVGEEPVTGLAAAVAAIASLPLDEPSTVTVLRDGRETVADIQAVPTLSATGGAFRLPPIGPAPRAGLLFSVASLASAGIPPEATVIAIDGRPMTERAATAYLRRRPGARLLYLAHGGHRFYAVAEARR